MGLAKIDFRGNSTAGLAFYKNFSKILGGR